MCVSSTGHPLLPQYHTINEWDKMFGEWTGAMPFPKDVWLIVVSLIMSRSRWRDDDGDYYGYYDYDECMICRVWPAGEYPYSYTYVSCFRCRIPNEDQRYRHRLEASYTYCDGEYWHGVECCSDECGEHFRRHMQCKRCHRVEKRAQRRRWGRWLD